ncbi:MAG: hypothetical protein WBE38_19255 [Terracidiphilus sp.]|jgi:hypothetical protein
MLADEADGLDEVGRVEGSMLKEKVISIVNSEVVEVGKWYWSGGEGFSQSLEGRSEAH